MAHSVKVPQHEGDITIERAEAGEMTSKTFKVHEGHIEVTERDLPTVLRHVDGAHEVKAPAKTK